MNELVKVKGNEIFTDSLVIAEGTNTNVDQCDGLLKSIFQVLGSSERCDLKSHLY